MVGCRSVVESVGAREDRDVVRFGTGIVSRVETAGVALSDSSLIGQSRLLFALRSRMRACAWLRACVRACAPTKDILACGATSCSK